MDCFNNTCLSCDRECEGHYCSQACKLTDIERGTQSFAPSSPTSPKATRSSNSSTDYASTAATQGSRRPQSSYFMWHPSMDSPEQAKSSERSLTPSSSRCSLSSTASSSSSNAISAHDTQHLQDYFNSLDKARAAKRRSSTR